MHTDTDDSMRVAVPVFPLGAAHGTLYDFYDMFHTYVGSSSALSLVFYHKTFTDLPRFPTETTDLEATIKKFKENYPDVDTAPKFRAASIRCCNKMKLMFKHHPEIIQVITNAEDDVKNAWKSILALAHVNMKEFVGITRQKVRRNICEAKDFVELSQGLDANVSLLQKLDLLKKALTDADKQTLNELRVRYSDREMTDFVCDHFKILDERLYEEQQFNPKDDRWSHYEAVKSFVAKTAAARARASTARAAFLMTTVGRAAIAAPQTQEKSRNSGGAKRDVGVGICVKCSKDCSNKIDRFAHAKTCQVKSPCTVTGCARPQSHLTIYHAFMEKQAKYFKDKKSDDAKSQTVGASAAVPSSAAVTNPESLTGHGYVMAATGGAEAMSTFRLLLHRHLLQISRS